MSTTVELGRMRDQRDAALVELDKLRAGIEALISRPSERMPENADGMVVHGRSSHSLALQCGDCPSFPHASCASLTDLRNLLGADS